METKALKKAMTDSIFEVLETMFFLPLDFDESDLGGAMWPVEGADTLVSQLPFRGAFSGRFHFLVPKSLAESITTSFLGIDDTDLTREQVNETVHEIINMVAGNTFSKYDDQQVFDLEVPIPVPYRDLSSIGADSENALIVPLRTLEDGLAFVLLLDV